MYLLGLPGDEVADGFAEEAGQERVEGRVLLQEVVEHLEEGLVGDQLVVDDGHVGCQELTGDVGKPFKENRRTTRRSPSC